MEQDELLLKRAQRGDADAFESLLTPHESRIYALCLRTMGSREDAMDCVQETMLRIFRALREYRGESAFSTWVYRIATNTCLDMLRRQKARPQTSLDALVDEGFSPSDWADTPEKAYDAREKREALAQGIRELPEDMRTAIVLRDVQGFSYEETARMLGVGMGTVKSRINRAREKLRTILRQNPEHFAAPSVYGHERRDHV